MGARGLMKKITRKWNDRFEQDWKRDDMKRIGRKVGKKPHRKVENLTLQRHQQLPRTSLNFSHLSFLYQFVHLYLDRGHRDYHKKQNIINRKFDHF